MLRNKYSILYGKKTSGIRIYAFFLFYYNNLIVGADYMNFKKFWGELRRRNIFRVAAVYAITAWLLIQIIATVFPILKLPEWSVTLLTVIILMGFPLSIIFAWAFEMTPEGLKRSSEVDKSESITHKTAKKINRIAIASLSLVIVFLVTERLFFANVVAVDEDGAVAQEASIAVLPFVNMSSDKENEYFSDGLSEELLNTLARVEDMKVAGRTSSFKFKGQNEDLKQVGQELGVSYILEGSVRKAGSQVRITAQLINVETGYHLWSDTYDRELKDIFAIQEEISRKVLNELKVRLLEEDETELETIPTGDVEAYQFFLKANQLMANRNITEINQAIELYHDAIRLDPGFAQAHANLAVAYNLQGYNGNVPFEQVQENMLEYVNRALLLNSDLGEAYGALGLYYSNEGDLEQAKNAFNRSLELNPNQPYVYGWLGNVVIEDGGLKEGIELHKKMYELDPLAPLAIYNRGGASMREGKYEEAEAFFLKNLRLNPDYEQTYGGLSFMYAATPFGRLDKSFEYAHQAIQRDSLDSRAYVFLTARSVDMNVEPLADRYLGFLKQNFSESFEYISIAGYYSWYKDDYSILENDVFTYLDENEITVHFPPFYWILEAYARDTQNIDRALDEFRKFDPALFEPSPGPISLKNYQQALALSEILRMQGDDTRADKLLGAYCIFAEPLKELTPLREESGEYLNLKVNCLLIQEKFEEAYPYFETLYLEKKQRFGTEYFFQRRWYQEALERPGFKQVHEQVVADLEEQRQNVIQYLKEQGEWE